MSHYINVCKCNFTVSHWLCQEHNTLHFKNNEHKYYFTTSVQHRKMSLFFLTFWFIVWYIHVDYASPDPFWFLFDTRAGSKVCILSFFSEMWIQELDSRDRNECSLMASKISAGWSNITLRSSSWRMKFIHHSKFPLPTEFIETALNSVSVLLKCQTETYCKHPFSRNEHLQYMEP